MTDCKEFYKKAKKKGAYIKAPKDNFKQKQVAKELGLNERYFYRLKDSDFLLYNILFNMAQDNGSLRKAWECVHMLRVARLNRLEQQLKEIVKDLKKEDLAKIAKDVYDSKIYSSVYFTFHLLQKAQTDKEIFKRPKNNLIRLDTLERLESVVNVAKRLTNV
jgi:uncharacterized protein (UPF0335 family)